MDTKLKRYNIVLKIAAYIGAAVSAFMIVLTAFWLIDTMEEKGYRYKVLMSSNIYEDTPEYWDDHLWINHVVEYIINAESEENILAGNTVTAHDIDQQTEYLFQKNYGNMYDHLVMETGETYISAEMVWELFNEDYADDIADIKNDLIQDHINEFRAMIYNVQSNLNLWYYFNLNGKIIANKDLKSIENSPHFLYAYYGRTPVHGAVAYKESYVDQRAADFLSVKQDALSYTIQISVFVLLFLLCFAYLIFAAGKKTVSHQEVYHPFIDKVYNEIILLLMFLDAAAFWYSIHVIYQDAFDRNFMIVLTTGTVMLFLTLLLVPIRHIKSRTLAEHTIIFIVLRAIGRALKKAWNAGPVMAKAMAAVTATVVLAVVLSILELAAVMLAIMLPLLLIATYMPVIKYLTVKKGIERVKSGIYNQQIEVQGSGEMAELAADINAISEGLGLEVERRLKSERLKTDLIVNVSHDIRTPLTSVITYVDLLKKEDIQNENAQKYIEVIAVKSERLKHLTDDLFDAAKASSGNIAVQCSEVDISELLTQGLGELDDKIKASSLEFKVNLPQEKVIAYADGKLTWRVLENLLSNVFKYSLEHSRVYIDIFQDEKDVYIEIKNISRAELNISEDEIMERFKRGDESRSSEGNGLGLDIAKSLMLCQKGELLIKIDGDLFKVKLRIPRMH